jgi:hypothetical protein
MIFKTRINNPPDFVVYLFDKPILHLDCPSPFLRIAMRIFAVNHSSLRFCSYFKQYLFTNGPQKRSAALTTPATASLVSKIGRS